MAWRRIRIAMRIVAPSKRTRPSRINSRTIATVSRVRVSGFPYTTPCWGSTCTLWLDPSPRMNRPPDMSATVEAAIAIVGAVRTKTLLILVPSWMREVRMAQAARIANWSPP